MKKLTIAIALLTLALIPVACHKENRIHQFQFTATTERPQNDDAKVRLVDERYILWEYDDEISIGSNTSGDDKYRAWLYYSTPDNEDWGAYNGIFLTTLPENSQYFLGLHPASDNNIISAGSGSAFTANIDVPATQTYRNDSTFDKQVFPMVAWYGGVWDNSSQSTPFNLDFRSLASIVRLQFVNGTGATSAIRSITVTSPDKQLNGLFLVNNYNTYDPYLTGLESSKRSVTIDCGSSGVAFPNNKLLTFYLVLPAFTGRDNTTQYNNLTVTVTNTSSQSCSRTIGSVKTRRNGISYMPALSIDAWASAPTPTIAGNGTEDRPFKVYDINDLKYLRDCYNSGTRTINGQPITANTYIKLMRSDIVLTQDNWAAGIRNFEGHFLTMNQQSNPGITNTYPNVPLFESIGSNGEVVGLTVKSSGSNTLTNATGVSPFCTQNDGRIIDCALTSNPSNSNYTISIFSSFAGICVTNNGTIQGCRCDARVQVQSNKNFAGICFINNGTIQGCQASDITLRDVTAKAAGICYQNSTTGTVKDCYFAANITESTADWGGIVYENSGIVKHCYMSATGHIYTSKGVGGIVRNNIGASSLVDYCYVSGPLQGRSVGGIVDSLVAGEVRNCFNSNTAMITVTTASSVGGGLVGYVKGGQVNNSYVKEITLIRRNNNAVIGGLAGAVTGGAFSYCYSYEDYNVFYGTSTTATYDHCYLVDGSQAGVTTVGNYPTTNFATLTTNLNGSGNSNYSTWVQPNASSAPELDTYQE